jgi:Neurotransmitter-gated ion-channel ligand binding domain
MGTWTKRSLSLTAGPAMVCLLTLSSLATPAARAASAGPAKPAVDLRRPPTDGRAPVDVAVGLYITNFVAIDETRESFEVGGFLTGKWRDPRLALTSDETSDNLSNRETPRTFRLGDIWAPAIEGANVISHTTNQYSLEADRNGTVTYLERFDAVFSCEYELRKFPFDSQVLRFEYQPFQSSASPIRFAAQALPGSGISPEQHTELAAWHLENLTYTADKMTSDAFLPATHEALFQIVVRRRSGFYLWKIFLPLMMITIIPVVVFWIDVKEFDWLLKIPMTMLLSMVAFQFTITRDLPRIGYVTFLDAVFLVSFAFCFLCVFEILTVYLLQKYGRRPLAVRLHSAGRWAYPLTYFSVISILAISFLG